MNNFARLEGECKVITKDGADLTNQDVSIINLFPNSLWKSCELSVNGVEVHNFFSYFTYLSPISKTFLQFQVQDQSTSCYPYKVRKRQDACSTTLTMM